MKTGLEAPGAAKEMLLMRSALCRLRLRRATHELRASLHVKRAPIAVARTTGGSRILFGVALSLLGLERTGRAVKILGRILVFSKLARFAIEVARTPSRRAVCANAPTAAPIARSL